MNNLLKIITGLMITLNIYANDDVSLMDLKEITYGLLQDVKALDNKLKNTSNSNEINSINGSIYEINTKLDEYNNRLITIRNNQQRLSTKITELSNKPFIASNISTIDNINKEEFDKLKQSLANSISNYNNLSNSINKNTLNIKNIKTPSDRHIINLINKYSSNKNTKTTVVHDNGINHKINIELLEYLKKSN